MVVVTKPEPYVLAVAFEQGQIWRMSLEGKDPFQLVDLGSTGLSLSIDREEPLRLWFGAMNGFYEGELRTKGFDLIGSK